MKKILCLFIITSLILTGCRNNTSEATEKTDNPIENSTEATETESENNEEVYEETEEFIPVNPYADLIGNADSFPVSDENFTLSSIEFAVLLKAGWNLGNTLDCRSYDGLKAETAWGQPKATKKLFDFIKECGFTSVRIPVSWGFHTSGENYLIDEEWMVRVKEVVDYAIDNDLYVIIDSHHDDAFFYPSDEHMDESLHFIECIWSQIAVTFRDYDEHLIFEGMNEPRLEGTDKEWSFTIGDAEAVASLRCIEQLNQKFVDTVRSTGGNNSLRYLFISGYAANPDLTIDNGFNVATDPANHLLMSIHAYTPYDFAMNDEGYAIWSEDKISGLSFMDKAYSYFVEERNMGVAITEMGAINKMNLSERYKWYDDYTKKASLLGMSCFQWDNGNNGIGKESFAFISRKVYKALYPELLEALTKNYVNDCEEIEN